MTGTELDARGERCPNCNAAGVDRFCPHCGQKQGTGVPRVREQIRELLNHYVAVDGKIWRTLWLLLARPGALDTDYIAGRRQRHIGPLKLYLSVSLVFFVLASLWMWPSPAVTVVLDPEEHDAAPATAASPEPPVHAAGEEAARPGARMAAPEQIGGQLIEQAPRAMFLLLPLFAVLTRLAFWRRPHPYAVHLMLAMHAHTAAYLLLIAALLPFAAADSLVLLMPVWLAVAFRRVFGGRWWALALRALAVSGAYALLLFAAVIGGALLLAVSLA